VKHLRGPDAFVFGRRKDACEDGFGNRGDRGAEFERVLRGPAARAFLLRAVENDVDERFAGTRVGFS